MRATGGTVLTRGANGWTPFEAFEAVDHSDKAFADLRHWRRPLIVGEAKASALLAQGR